MKLIKKFLKMKPKQNEKLKEMERMCNSSNSTGISLNRNMPKARNKMY